MRTKSALKRLPYLEVLHKYIFDWLIRAQTDFACNYTFIVTVTPLDSDVPVKKVLSYNVVKMRMRLDWRNYCEKTGQHFSTKEFQKYFDYIFELFMENLESEAKTNRLIEMGALLAVEGEMPSDPLE